MKLSRAVAACVLLGALTGALRAAEIDPALDRALARLPRVGTIIYTTAHPDDESAAVLTYLARGLNMRVVLIAFTRGEGGQNSTSAQLSDELRWVRTRELGAACATYGVELRFLGASDFGYSKRVEETLETWDTEALVGQLVRHIRELKPVAIISGFTGTDRDGGGSHHQASGILTRQAFALATETTAYAEQLEEGLLPWRTRYLLTRNWSGEGEQAKFTVPVERVDPLTGKTFEEIGWEGFRQHASQGMGQIDPSRFRGRRRTYTQSVVAGQRGGPPAPTNVEDLAPTLSQLPELFPSIESLVEWRPRLKEIELLAEDARAQASPKPGEAAKKLVQAAEWLAVMLAESASEEAGLERRHANAWLEEKRKAFLQAAARVAGVELQAVASRATVSPGDRVPVRLAVEIGNPSAFHAAGFELDGLDLIAPENWRLDTLQENGGDLHSRRDYVAHVPDEADLSALPSPVLLGRCRLRVGKSEVEIEAPVRGQWVSPEESEESGGLAGVMRQLDPRRLFRLGRGSPNGDSMTSINPVVAVPAVTLAVDPKLRLARAGHAESTADFRVDLLAHRLAPELTAWIDVPEGWYSPEPQEAGLPEPDQTVGRMFSVELPEGLAPGRYVLSAAAGHGDERFGRTLRRIERGLRADGGEKPPLYLSGPAQASVQVVDVEAPDGLRVGYVGFPDDPVPSLLADLGILVERLDEEMLAGSSLSPYSTIVIANRVYDARKDLAAQNSRLLEYVEAGGVLLVEHQGRGWDPEKFAPHPGKKPARPNLRVTVESAPIRMLAPGHPVLSFPNRIGPADWQGWVQERGLYFWQEWSEQYTPLLELADPGEEPLQGSLLYARHGQGAYIYCGLALFRQVRAGVPGGVRLYVNLLSQGFALLRSTGRASD